MGILNFMGKKVINFMPEDLIVKKFFEQTAGETFEGVNVPELFIVLNRLATDFSTGFFELADLDGNTIENPTSEEMNLLDKLNSGDQFSPLENTLYREMWFRKLAGYSALYFRKGEFGISDYILLQNDSFALNYKTNLDPFTENNGYLGFIDSIDYSFCGYNKKLESKDLKKMLFTFDIGFDHKTLKPFKRLERAKQKLELADNTNKSLIKSMERMAQILLCDAPNQNPLSSVQRTTTGILSNDADAQKMQETAKEKLSIENGSYHYINKQMVVLDTNPDNGKLKAFEGLEHVLRALCYAFDVPYELFDSKTTFNNQSYILKRYVATLETEGNVLGGSIADKLNLKKERKRTLKLNFEKYIKTLLAESGQDVNNIDNGTEQQAATGEGAQAGNAEGENG